MKTDTQAHFIILVLICLFVLTGCKTAGKVVGGTVLIGAMATGGVLAGGSASLDCAGSGGSGYKKSGGIIKLGGCNIADGNGYKTRCSIESADLKSFKSLGKVSGIWWARDKNTIYRSCTALAGVKNPLSFQKPKRFKTKKDFHEIFLSGDYVIIDKTVLEAADPNSFAAVSQSLYKDKNSVWRVSFYGNVSRLDGVDSTTFEVLKETWNSKNYHWDTYSKDRYHVYFNESVISQNPDSFCLEQHLFSQKN